MPGRFAGRTPATVNAPAAALVTSTVAWANPSAPQLDFALLLPGGTATGDARQSAGAGRDGSPRTMSPSTRSRPTCRARMSTHARSPNPRASSRRGSTGASAAQSDLRASRGTDARVHHAPRRLDERRSIRRRMGATGCAMRRACPACRSRSRSSTSSVPGRTAGCSCCRSSSGSRCATCRTRTSFSSIPIGWCLATTAARRCSARTPCGWCRSGPIASSTTSSKSSTTPCTRSRSARASRCPSASRRPHGWRRSRRHGDRGRWQGFDLIRPKTHGARFTGGYQISVTAHATGDRADGSMSPSLPGAAWQTRNGVDP